MAILNNSNRSTKVATSITYSQKPSCTVVFYKWQNPTQAQLTDSVATSGADLLSSVSAAVSTISNFLGGKMIVDNDVVRVSVSNNKGSSSGAFSITLKRGNREPKGGGIPLTGTSAVDYLQAINPGDWVMIYAKRTNKVDAASVDMNSGLKFLGIVDSVRFIEIDDPHTSTPRLEYLVSGRSFGKVFEGAVVFNPAAQSFPLATILGAKFMGDSAKVKGNATKDPQAVILQMLSYFLGGHKDPLDILTQTWYIPPSLAVTYGLAKDPTEFKVTPSFIQILAKDRIGLHKYATPGIGQTIDLFAQAQGYISSGVTKSNPQFVSAGPLFGEAIIKAIPPSSNIWSMLHDLSNPGLNEMFVDLAIKNSKLVPSLTVRQIPFSTTTADNTNIFKIAKATSKDTVSKDKKTLFADLPRYEIVSSRILQKNVGKSDFERINYISATPRLDQKGEQFNFAAMSNTSSINKYGVKALPITTQYALAKNNNYQDYCKKCIALAADWFMMAHAFYNGTIIIDGTDEFIELGTNLYITDIKQLFHIEGYTHTYEVLPDTGAVNYTTEFRVSRGQHFDGTLDFIEGKPGDTTHLHTTIARSMLENVRNNK